MKAFAIKCNDHNCDDCDLWLGYAKRTLCSNRVSFPLLGVFGFVQENNKICWRHEKTCKLIIEAINNERSSEDPKYLTIISVEWPDDKVIGCLRGESQ